MKKLLIAVIVAALASGCASVEERRAQQMENNAVTMNHVDITYCDGTGFKRFQDLGRYWSFVCKDDRKFIVKYK